MWETLFGNAVTPVITQGAGEALANTAVPAVTDSMMAGAGEALANTAVPAVTDTALQTGINTAVPATMGNSVGNFAMTPAMVNGAIDNLPNAISNNGFNMLGQAGNQAIANTAPTGIMESLGKIGNALTSDQAKNAFSILGTGYNMYNQGQALNNAKDIQRQQLQMSKDAYGRDKVADQRRQKLVF